MSTLKNDDSGQIGGIAFFFFGLFVVGVFIIIFGTVEQQFVDGSNDLIQNPTMPVSQNRVNALSTVFLSWASLAVYALLLFLIYAFKYALKKEPQETY